MSLRQNTLSWIYPEPVLQAQSTSWVLEYSLRDTDLSDTLRGCEIDKRAFRSDGVEIRRQGELYITVYGASLKHIYLWAAGPCFWDVRRKLQQSHLGKQKKKKKKKEEIVVRKIRGAVGWCCTMEMLRVLRRKKVMWLVLAGVVAWIVLLFSISIVLFWSCEANSRYPGQCKKKRKMFMLLGALGFFPGPPHRCPIPLLDSPYTIHTPKLRKTGQYPLYLTYVTGEELNTTEKKVPSLFGGNQTWQQRDESFDIKSKMKVHCGFAGKTGAEISNNDQEYLKQCRFLVASGIFSGYDQPHQPSNISLLSQKVFCFIMVVDTKSLQTVGTGGYLTQDEMGNKWVGIWRLLELKNLPFDEPRRNGKVPKLLLHRLFPDTEYSIWIDGKLELVIDPLLILERYLWRGNHSFAIARHKHHRSVYDEAEANKRRKRYARPLIDKHMDVYRREGFQPWTEEKLPLLSDVPEGAIIIREHTPMTNLFSCLWFNEVNRFTPRDQLSFGYVVYKLKDQFPFFMFPNCEYNSLALLHKHMREHSSKVEWVKNLEELKEGNTMVETRGGIGLWTPANNLSLYESAKNTSNLK